MINKNNTREKEIGGKIWGRNGGRRERGRERKREEDIIRNNKLSY